MVIRTGNGACHSLNRKLESAPEFRRIAYEIGPAVKNAIARKMPITVVNAMVLDIDQ
jgi:hypothetical protein